MEVDIKWVYMGCDLFCCLCGRHKSRAVFVGPEFELCKRKQSASWKVMEMSSPPDIDNYKQGDRSGTVNRGDTVSEPDQWLLHTNCLSLFVETIVHSFDIKLNDVLLSGLCKTVVFLARQWSGQGPFGQLFCSRAGRVISEIPHPSQSLQSCLRERTVKSISVTDPAHWRMAWSTRLSGGWILPCLPLLPSIVYIYLFYIILLCIWCYLLSCSVARIWE